MIEVTLDKSDDTADVILEDDQAIIDVRSASGIGGLHAALVAGDWPSVVVVRLHLKGLERMEIGYGQFLIVSGFSSTSEPAPLPSVYAISEAGGSEPVIDADKGFYPTIHVVPAEGSQPAIPLQNGYFEVALPPDFYIGQPDAFTLQWIDFYR